MSDIGEHFAFMKERAREKRQSNTEFSTKLIQDSGVDFESKNNGAHLVIKAESAVIDFWPSTGLWIPRGGRKNRGVKKLLKFIKEKTQC